MILSSCSRSSIGKGLSMASGMPAGSPGMEMEGRAAAKYDVLLIAKDGTTTVWASH